MVVSSLTEQKDNHHFTELGYGSYWTTSLKKAENIINSRTTDRSLEIKETGQERC